MATDIALSPIATSTSGGLKKQFLSSLGGTCLFLLLQSATPHPAIGDTFSATFRGDSQGHEYSITASSSSHIFEVIDVPKNGVINPGIYVEWYVNGEYEDLDRIFSWSGDPSYSYGEKSGTYRISAELYDADWRWIEAHHWNVTVEREETRLTAYSAEATAGQELTLLARIQAQALGIWQSRRGLPVRITVGGDHKGTSVSEARVRPTAANVEYVFRVPLEWSGTESWCAEFRGNAEFGPSSDCATLTMTSPPLDAAVDILSVDPDPLVAGGQLTFRYRVTNTGSGTHRFGIGATIETRASSGSWTPHEHVRDLPDEFLDPGSSSEQTWTYQLSDNASDGLYRLVLAVWTGPAGESERLDSTDRSFQVEQSTVNAQIEVLSVAPDHLAPGESIMATYRVLNTGTRAHKFGIGATIERREPGGDWVVHEHVRNLLRLNVDPGAYSHGTLEYRFSQAAPSDRFRLVMAAWTGNPGDSVRLSSAYFSVDARVVSVTTPDRDVRIGESLTVYVRLENTGTHARSFWVGLSFFSDASEKWPTGWMDVHPVESPVIEPGKAVTLELPLVVPDFPEGEYGALVAVWSGYDPETTVPEQLLPGQMVHPRLDEWPGRGFIIVDDGEADPYQLASYDNLALFPRIPLRQRNELMDLRDQDLEPLITKTGRVLSASDKKLLFLCHGWNWTGSSDAPYLAGGEPTPWRVLYDVDLPVDWSMVPYSWSNDAATLRAPREVVGKRAVAVLLYLVTRYTLELSAANAAMRGYEHGLLLVKKLEQQDVIAGLEKVQIVGHSAGAWVALGLAQGLAYRGSPDLEIQVVYLDPFIPAQTLAAKTWIYPPARHFDSATLADTPLHTRVASRNAPKAQAFYAIDLKTDQAGELVDRIPWFKEPDGPTSVTWDWSAGDGEGLVMRTDRGVLAHWSGHSGPLAFYAESTAEPESDRYAGHGWAQSLVYSDSRSPVDHPPPPEPPNLSVEPNSLAFDTVRVGDSSAAQSLFVHGTQIPADMAITVTASESYEVSLSANGRGTPSVSVPSQGEQTAFTVFVRFTPSAAGQSTGQVTVSCGCGPTASVEVSGVGASPTSAPSPGELTVALPGGVEMHFRHLSAGTFRMGSPSTEPGRDPDEGPQHDVTITRDFYLGKFEVTQAQWEALMGTRPWLEDAGQPSGPDYPVSFVSWRDALAFTSELTEQARGQEGLVFRLPTEAEWEYACRAGTTTMWSFGDNEQLLGNYAWYVDNSGFMPHPVGLKLPNPWGLHDMHGNVWEGVYDWYGQYTSRLEVDPRGPDTGPGRAGRGGRFANTARRLRSANRDDHYSELFRSSGVGFRVLGEPGTEVPTLVDMPVPGSHRRLLFSQNYPNPFNASTIFEFELPTDQRHVQVSIHNVSGQQVVVLFSGTLPAGRHALRWAGHDPQMNDVASGVYLCRLRTDAGDTVRRLLLLR